MRERAGNVEISAEFEPIEELDSAALEKDVSDEPGSILRPLVTGIATTLVAGWIWGELIAVTGYYIQVAAIAVGVSVGAGIRETSRTHGMGTGILAIGIASVGLLLGDTVAVVRLLAAETESTFFTVLFEINPGTFGDLLLAEFTAYVLLFHGLALAAAYGSAINTRS